MSGGLFEGVEKNLIGGLTNVAQGQMMIYSSMMMGLAATSATLYIMWRGYQTLAGKLSTPMEDTMWDIMRMAIILSFVANVSGYLDGVIDAINGLKEGFSGGDNIWQMLDSLWENAKFLGKTLHDMDNATYIKDEGMQAQFYVWLGTFALMIVTAFVSMVAEVMIMLLSITAPIFIFCLMYGFLRPMFNNWLQNIFAAILTILFSALSLRIVIDFTDSVMKAAIDGAGGRILFSSVLRSACLASARQYWCTSPLKLPLHWPEQAPPYPCRVWPQWVLVLQPLAR